MSEYADQRAHDVAWQTAEERNDSCTAEMYAASPSEIADALDWLVECFTDLDEFMALGGWPSPREIVLGVERHYEGGWSAFLAAR